MGALDGIRILEVAGIGPGPFCAMMLADHGAEVLRIDRKSHSGQGAAHNVLNRGRRSVALDLKNPEAVELVLRLVEEADGLLEGFRPGVTERLGLGPEACLERNPRLVYGRMTGWGQEGPLAHAAGHDINYIALSGALHAIGSGGVDGAPVPPLNLVGDFGGGGMLLAFGMVCALLEARSSGRGQVVDAAMTDGAALLMAAIYGLRGAGLWTDRRQDNLLDGGAHFYGVFRCSDGEHVAVGSIEPQFYKLLLDKLEIGPGDELRTLQMDRAAWPQLRRRLAEIFAQRTRAEWCERMEGSDVCFAPVLAMEDAMQHRHNRARETFVEIDGIPQPAPAPRFSRTPADTPGGPAKAGEHNREALRDWGLSKSEIEEMEAAGAL